MTLKIIKPPTQNVNITPSTKSSTISQTLLIGGYDKIYRALIQFGTLGMPVSLNIISGILNLYIFRNENHLIDKIIDVYQILSPWDAANVSWENQPLIADKPLTSIIITDRYLGSANANITNLVKEWCSGQRADFGILLKMRDESQQCIAGCYSDKYPNVLNWPFLEINYLDDCCASSPTQLTDTIPITATYTLQNAGVRDVLLFDYSYLVINIGTTYPAQAYLEVSADGVHWEVQSSVKIIPCGQQISFIPSIIAQYARLCYQTLEPKATTKLIIHIQGRT